MPPEKNAAGNRLVSIGSSPPREYSLDKATIAIGSHPSNDIVLDDTTVSRRHAAITRNTDKCELADLGSTNGTFVNNQRIAQPTRLGDGDLLRFGNTQMKFRTE